MGKLGTKLFDYTPLFNFPAPKLLRNPALGLIPLGMAEMNSFPQEEKEAQCLHKGAPHSLLPKGWLHSSKTKLGTQEAYRVSTLAHFTFWKILWEWGEFLHCPISPPTSPKGRPTLPQCDEKWISAITYFIFSPFVTNIYLKGESLWMSVWNMKKGCCHLMRRDESISKRTQHPLLPVPQDYPASQFCAI